jgi:flagellar biosynthetic protein FliO
MIVRRYLFATALAVLIGAQPSVALAASPTPYRGGALAPHLASSAALSTQPIVDVRDIGTADIADTAPHSGVRLTHAKTTLKPSQSRFESTPLGIGTLKPATHTSSSGGSSIVRTLFGLIVVIGLIYGVSWVLRRVKRSREAQATGNGLASVATLPLGPGRSLHLVRAGTDVILVGTSEHGVTPIASYTEEEALANGVLSEAGGEAMLHDAARAFSPAAAPTAHTPAGATKGQWRGLDAPDAPAPKLVETLRRLTVR